MKRALVTGGSGAIGSAICRALAARGLEVIVHGNRNPEAAAAVAAAINAAGGRARAVAFDVTDAEATAAALEAILEAGPIQVLVNNAGVHDDAAFPGMRLAQWHRVIDVSLNGFFHVTQPLLMPMIRTRWGRIVNVTSIAGQIGNRGQANYAAAKGALHAATRSLSLELASRGITVNAVAPGHHRHGHERGQLQPRGDRGARADEARRRAPRRSRASSPSSPPTRPATSRAR